MNLNLSPALQERFSHMATETEISANELMQQAMQSFVDEYDETKAAVKEADEQFERGQFLTSDEALARIQRRFPTA